MLKVHNTRFPVTSRKRGSCQLVAALLATGPTSPQQVVVMEFGKRDDETTKQTQRTLNLRAPTCYGLVVYVADLLWTCYTGKPGYLMFEQNSGNILIEMLVCNNVKNSY